MNYKFKYLHFKMVTLLKNQRVLVLLFFAISFSCKSHNNNLNIPIYNVRFNNENNKLYNKYPQIVDIITSNGLTLCESDKKISKDEIFFSKDGDENLRNHFSKGSVASFDEDYTDQPMFFLYRFDFDSSDKNIIHQYIKFLINEAFIFYNFEKEGYTKMLFDSNSRIYIKENSVFFFYCFDTRLEDKFNKITLSTDKLDWDKNINISDCPISTPDE